MNANWKHVHLESYHLTFNKYDRPQYFDCSWCGRPAIKALFRESAISGNKYEDYVCEVHAKEWEEIQDPEQLAFDLG